MVFRMSFLIFWDSTSPQGLQIPVAQAIGAILGTHVELQENPVMLRGFDGARGQYNASHILTGMQDIYTANMALVIISSLSSEKTSIFRGAILFLVWPAPQYVQALSQQHV